MCWHCQISGILLGSLSIPENSIEEDYKWPDTQCCQYVSWNKSEISARFSQEYKDLQKPRGAIITVRAFGWLSQSKSVYTVVMNACGDQDRPTDIAASAAVLKLERGLMRCPMEPGSGAKLNPLLQTIMQWLTMQLMKTLRVLFVIYGKKMKTISG